MDLRIAGVRYALADGRDLSFRAESQNYRNFVVEADGAIDRIAIRLERDNFPDTGRMVRIFDTGQSWALFRDADDYVFEYKPPAVSVPFWVARVDGRFERATVHYGESLVIGGNGAHVISDAFLYPLDQLLLMHVLSRRQGALIHAAGLSIDGRGFMFPGKSGAGKSTLSRLFLGRDHVDLLSDDRVVARKLGGAFEVFGTPWAGDAGIAENRHYPLSGMMFIRHAPENALRRMSAKEAFESLMPVTSIPWYDETLMSRILTFCEDLVLNIPAYELAFRPDGDLVGFLEKFGSTQPGVRTA